MFVNVEKKFKIDDAPLGFPGGASGKESACQCWRRGFDPQVGKIPRRRKWQPIPGFLPGKSHGQSLMGQSPWGHERVRYNLATEQQQKCIKFKSYSLLSDKILEQYRLLGYANSFFFKSRHCVLKINIKIASRTTELIISLIS